MLLVLTFSALFSLIQNEEISRHEFLADELEQKLEHLKYDIQSIEKFVHSSLLYQNELDNSTEVEYEYEDYEEADGSEPVDEEDYNYEYNYEDYEGSTDEIGERETSEEEEKEVIVTESTAEEAVATRGSTSLPTRLGRQMREKGSKKKKVGKKGKKKGKKVKKGKKKEKKARKVKKQKGLSAGSGSTVTSNTKRTRGISLTPEQVREICSTQPPRQGGGQGQGGTGSKPAGNAGWRGVNQGGPTNPNEFAAQFKQLTQSFAELQSALQSFRKSSGASGSVTGGSSNEPTSIDNRDTVAGQDSEVGPLVQAALGAQSAAANALRGLLPSGKSD